MISAVVLTKNEEKNIERCLRSIKWCDEIIIVDDCSTDKTLELAKKYTSRIYIRELNGNFSQQRNFGLEKSKNEWVLFIDADEEISLSLQYEITNQISNQFNSFSGFFIKRLDEMWGRKLYHGEVGNIVLLRLARRDCGAWLGRVHETWNVKGKIAELQNPMFHYPHQSISAFLEEINYYSDLRASELIEKNYHVSSWQIIIYPKAKFVINYFLKTGFLDGTAGLVIALMMSFHSFLVRSKIWTSQHRHA